MTGATRPAVFVTGAAGFIGSALVRTLSAAGHRTLGLAPTMDAAERIRRAGATPVAGNLLAPGGWQDEAAAADWVFHLPPHPSFGSRLSAVRAASIARERVAMDAHLLDAVAGGAAARIVYVGDSRFYGATGTRPVTEDAPPRPSARGRCFAPALDRVDGYVVAGLPIVTAFPGWVYGSTSWLRVHVIDRVLADRPVAHFGSPGALVSPIHVDDCARALLHLAGRGEAGGRYFVVNTDPVRLPAFAETLARLAGRRLRTRRETRAGARLRLGPLLADFVESDAAYSNIRLRSTRFQFRYPTLDDGLTQILETLDAAPR
jgi:nucleoside-diphosphate-sugar epimerase